MAKIMIVSHRGEASQLLEALQQEGICQILDAESAAISKQIKELAKGGERPRDVEEELSRLAKAIEFLKPYTKKEGGLAAAFAPKAVVDKQTYRQVTSDRSLPEIVEQCNAMQAAIEKDETEIDNLTTRLEELSPWEGLEVAIDEFHRLKQAKTWVGLVPDQRFEKLLQDITNAGGFLEEVAQTKGRHACIVVGHISQAEDFLRILRSAEFEQANFAGIKGTIAEAIKEVSQRLERAKSDLAEKKHKASALADNLLKIEILYDHYTNLLKRQQTQLTAPATQATVILEGWVKQKDFSRLEKIVNSFTASSLHKIEPAEGEEIPVEIENKIIVRPFEVITRLYGMPNRTSVDPTVFLAPFFALFFGLCLADAAYGLIMIVLLAWVLKKMQGDKLIIWMLAMCGVTTMLAGVLTGSWFSDALQQFEFLAFLRPIKDRLMWFDPMKQPMLFFLLSLGLGYVQIQFGFFIALINNLLKKDIPSALCDQLTWIVLLNSLLGLGLSKAGVLPAGLSKVFGILALIAAAGVLVFSGHAQGWNVGRFGIGLFNLFSTVFFAGDILSYVRLMALGMVGSGFGMAINVLVKLVMDVPYVGWILGAVVFVGGHLFNLALSMLGAFVHSLRLQFVEFFPKFLVGGGHDFTPLRKDYRYISIESKGLNATKTAS